MLFVCFLYHYYYLSTISTNSSLLQPPLYHYYHICTMSTNPLPHYHLYIIITTYIPGNISSLLRGLRSPGPHLTTMVTPCSMVSITQDSLLPTNYITTMPHLCQHHYLPPPLLISSVITSSQ